MIILAKGSHNYACCVLLYKQTENNFIMKTVVLACIARSKEEAIGLALEASKVEDSSTSWTREVSVVLIDYLED
jgi:hypothetical protein